MPSIREFAAARAAGRKIAVITAYDTWSARLLAKTPVDALLVGDSAMNVVHGHADTLSATPELMAMHTQAVARGAGDKLIIADMPFLSVRRGIGPALDCAALLMRAGAHAVKLEGVRGHADVVHHLVESGIPVMGHIGLTPQAVHGLGGFHVQGRSERDAARLRVDAADLEKAGVFSIVLECVPQALAAELTAGLRVPTIGIGAGPDCDGQVLVFHDLLGLNPDFQPRFVRQFADAGKAVSEGATKYAAAVHGKKFPSAKESFE